MGLIFRQGDIILKRISTEKFLNLERATNLNLSGYAQVRSNTVAHGEATGHQHKFTSGQVLLFKVNAGHKDPTLALIQSEQATLSHQQHLPIQVPQGLYQITRERTYNQFEKRLETIED